MADISSNRKLIVKNTFLLYFRMLFTMLVGLYTSRIVLAELGVDNYGLYNVVGGIVVILSFLNGAMANSTQRYLNIELGKGDKDRLKRIYVTSVVIHFLVALVVVIIAETLGLYFLNYGMNISTEKIEAANWVYQFSIAAFVFNVISVPFNAAIIAHEKMSAFAYLSIVEVTLRLLVAFLLCYAPVDKLIYYALLLFVVAIITRQAYSWYCHRFFEECIVDTYKIDKGIFRSMLSFSFWTIFGSFAFVLHTQGIAIIINLFFSTTVNAAQGVSNQLNNMVKGFVQGFLTALNPQVIKNYASGNMEELHKLVLTGSRMSFYLVLIFIIPLILEAPLLLSYWLTEVPEYTVLFVRLLLLISLFDSFNNLLNAAKGATGNIKSYMITQTTISMLHLPLSWLFFKMGYEPYYAMIIYLVLVIIMQSTRIWFVCKAISLSIAKFYTDVVLRCLTVMVIAFIPPYLLYIYMPQTFFSMVLVGTLSLVVSAITILYHGFTQSERIGTLRLVKNKIRIKK